MSTAIESDDYAAHKDLLADIRRLGDLRFVTQSRDFPPTHESCVRDAQRIVDDVLKSHRVRDVITVSLNVFNHDIYTDIFRMKRFDAIGRVRPSKWKRKRSSPKWRTVCR